MSFLVTTDLTITLSFETDNPNQDLIQLLRDIENKNQMINELVENLLNNNLPLSSNGLTLSSDIKEIPCELTPEEPSYVSMKDLMNSYNCNPPKANTYTPFASNKV